MLSEHGVVNRYKEYTYGRAHHVTKAKQEEKNVQIVSLRHVIARSPSPCQLQTGVELPYNNTLLSNFTHAINNQVDLPILTTLVANGDQELVRSCERWRNSFRPMPSSFKMEGPERSR